MPTRATRLSAKEEDHSRLRRFLTRRLQDNNISMYQHRECHGYNMDCSHNVIYVYTSILYTNSYPIVRLCVHVCVCVCVPTTLHSDNNVRPLHWISLNDTFFLDS